MNWYKLIVQKVGADRWARWWWTDLRRFASLIVPPLALRFGIAKCYPVIGTNYPIILILDKYMYNIHIDSLSNSVSSLGGGRNFIFCRADSVVPPSGQAQTGGAKLRLTH